MKYDVINIHTCRSSKEGDGVLSFFEGGRDIPFDIKRIYFIYEVNKDVMRGYHAHKLNQQLLFCPYGKIEILLDDGYSKESVMLDDPSKGLILYPGLWRNMLWHETGSILCVAASEYYDPDEYIRNYDEFLKYVEDKREEE